VNSFLIQVQILFDLVMFWGQAQAGALCPWCSTPRGAIPANGTINGYNLPVTLWVMDRQNEELTLSSGCSVPSW